MIKIYSTLLIVFLSIALCTKAQKNNAYAVLSPDKKTRMEIKSERGVMKYRMLQEGKEILQWSEIGFSLDNKSTVANTEIINKKESKHAETFSWPLGENDKITNQYSELVLQCKSASLTFSLICRVFDGSIAFRYLVPQQNQVKEARLTEHTSFNLPHRYTIYQYHHESVYTPVSIDSLTTSSDLPSTLAYSNEAYICIGEADNSNYTKAELRKGAKPNSLAIAFVRDSVVSVSGSFKTPWRTISYSPTAIGLHRFSELNLKLTSPSNFNPSLVKPGKLIRSQLTTQSGLDCIDFAAKHNFQYIMFDAGWYGAEFRTSSDPTTVIPEIDMQKVIDYGKSKGIGVILYVNYVGLKAKLDTILPLYKKWGVAGLKFGFVDGFTQAGISWLSAAMKKVADYGFVLNIHDNYKPTGLSRTYPNLLTQEGIRGDENSPDAFHTTTLPFTRFLAGPADFTYCFPNPTSSFSKNLLVSKGQQLALTVVYFSPLQAMFWYGKPNDYTNEDEIEFFRYVPTVWNESHYLAGSIGKNISVARRKGTTWFVGNATGFDDWKHSIKLDFLTAGKQYIMSVFEDDGQGSIRKRIVEVKKGDVFPIDVKAKCGQALMIELKN